MAVTLAGGCRVSQMHEGECLIAGTLRVWPQIGRATGAQAISLSIMEFATGMSPTIRNDDCDEILYVVEPELPSCADVPRQIFINGNSYDVTAGTGIFLAPGQTFALDNPGPRSVSVVSSRCPDPDRPHQFRTRMPTSQPTAASPIVRLADQQAQPTADRWYRVLIDERVGSTQVTQFVGSIPPGRAPDHFHQYEEVLFILKGEGRMWAGETNTAIGEGSCIYLPKRQVHCVENTGEGELRLLGVFYPAGIPSVRYEA